MRRGEDVKLGRGWCGRGTLYGVSDDDVRFGLMCWLLCGLCNGVLWCGLRLRGGIVLRFAYWLCAVVARIEHEQKCDTGSDGKGDGPWEPVAVCGLC